MRSLRWLLAAVLAVAAYPGDMLAQGSGVITGTVVEQGSTRPIVGAQVLLAGTNRRAITDQQGRYEIGSVPAGQQTVRATFIGREMVSRTVTVADGQTVTVDFALAPSAVELDALVVNAVTGRTERVKEIGNSVGQINVAEEVELATITRPADLLQGRVAGVTLQSVNGTTGTGQKIRIRGANSLSLSNEPLIIVDGVRYSNSTALFGGSNAVESTIDQDPNRLNDLNPEDIQSIEVLKGPAASGIYGTAAANGVVVITTKQGRAGGARWNFYAEAGTVEEVTDYPDNFESIGDQGRTCYLFRVAGDDPRCSAPTIFSFNPLRDPRTTPFRDGSRQKYGLSVSGGSDRATYYLSGDFENEEGVYPNNEVTKANFRTNVRALISDRLTVTGSVGYTSSDAQFTDNDNSIISPILNGMLGFAQFDPADPDAVYAFFAPSITQQYGPTQEVERFVGSVNANWQPLSWLSANATAGVDLFNSFDEQVLQPNTIPLSATWVSGWVQEARANVFTYTFNGAANATFDLSDAVRSTSTAGFDYNHQLNQGTSAFGAGLTPGTSSLAGTSSEFRADENNIQNKTVGGFLQQQFALRDRIFLTGAIRADDNSAFGEDFGVVTYPSASLSWIISEEDFFPQTEVLSSLRLRAAYGKSGLRPEFRDAVDFFNPAAVQVGGADVPGISIGGTGNVALEPEKTTEFETGFDAGFLNDRLSLELTYFNKKSDDALIQRDLQPSFGLFSSRFENLGEVRNKGVEFGLDARLLNTDPVQLNLRLSGATLDNEIVELGEGIAPIIFNRGMQEHREGQSAGSFYGPVVTFADEDGDGLIDLDEYSVGDTSVLIGPSLPEFTGSLSGDLTLFDVLRVSTLFDTRRGHYQLNDNESFRCGFLVCAGAFDPNSSLRAQAAFLADIVGDANGRTTNSLYVEEADFVKWRELAFTLTPPNSWTDRIGRLEGLSLTIAGRNLKTWTDYSGLDPETNESGSSSNFTQGEFGTQAPVRYWTARINLTF